MWCGWHGGEVLEEICRFPSACVSVQGWCGTATKSSGGKRRNKRRRKLSGWQRSKVSPTRTATYHTQHRPPDCLVCMEPTLMVRGHQMGREADMMGASCMLAPVRDNLQWQIPMDQPTGMRFRHQGIMWVCFPSHACTSRGCSASLNDTAQAGMLATAQR
jgi:hypothetical protein